MCDSNHFTFPEPSRWSVLYSEINTLVSIALVESRGGGGRKNHGENNIWQGLVQGCVDGLKVEDLAVDRSNICT